MHSDTMNECGAVGAGQIGGVWLCSFGLSCTEGQWSGAGKRRLPMLGWKWWQTNVHRTITGTYFTCAAFEKADFCRSQPGKRLQSNLRAGVACAGMRMGRPMQACRRIRNKPPYSCGPRPPNPLNCSEPLWKERRTMGPGAFLSSPRHGKWESRLGPSGRTRDSW